jgi:hypothetical protein
MKYQLLNNEPLQFFNEAGELIGTILISGSGDMLLRPESGSSRDIILGNRDTVGDVEIGLPSAESTWKFMGGGTISANGNTLTIGSPGDTLIFGAPITASNVISSSYAISASHLIGGGGGSVPAGTVSGSAQITLLGFVTSSATASFITNSQTSSMTVESASFAITASHATTAANAGTTVVANPGSSGGGALSTVTIGGSSFSVGGGSGGGSIFTASNGYQQTINNLIISESNNTSSLTIINSGSTIFDVQGSVGQLFEVQDDLDGVLMSVNDISGIPILTVSSSGDVILAEGSTLQGTAATASFVAGVSAAFPFAGAGVITGSLDITGSGNDIFKVKSKSGSLFSVDDGLDGILMSVNDISGLPLFEVSSSGDVELVTGNISGSALSTASFGHLMNDGLNFDTAVSKSAQAAGFGSGGGGGSVPAGTVSGSAQITLLGFVTSSATASFVTTSQTSSFMTSSLTGSFNNLTITNFSGSLIPGTGATSSIAVTVADVNGSNKYLLNSTVTASISLTAGNSYKFDQSDASNANGGSHPFRFSTDTGGSSNYSTGVTISGTPGDAGAFVQISVTNSTPTLYYYCTNHSNMGLGGTLSIITGSQIQNGFLEVSGSTRLSGSLDVLTDITASGNISSSGTITAANFVGVSAFPFSGDAQITGSLLISGSDPKLEFDSGINIQSKTATNTGIRIGYSPDIYEASQPQYSVVIGYDAKDGPSSGTNYDQSVSIGRLATGGYYAVAIGGQADAGSSGAVAIGAAAVANGNYGISIGNGATTAASAISIGKGANGGTNQGTITIGTNTTNNKQNSIVLNATTAVVTNGSHDTFATYMSDSSTPDFTIVHDGTSFMTGTGTFEFRNTGGIISTGSLTVSGSKVDFTDATAISGSTFSGSFVGNGSGLTNLPASNPFPFAGDAQITGSLIVSSSNSTASLSLHGSGSTLFEVIGSEGTIFSLDDELDGTLFTVNDRSGIPQFEVSSSGLVEIDNGPLKVNTFETGSIANGSPSSPLQMTMPSGSSKQLYGVGGYYRASWDDGAADHVWFQDDNIKLSYDQSGVDIEGTITKDPAVGEIHIITIKDGSYSALDKQVSDGIFDLNATFGSDNTDTYTFAAPKDPTWPYYRVTVSSTGAAHDSYFYAIVEKFI